MARTGNKSDVEFWMSRKMYRVDSGDRATRRRRRRNRKKAASLIQQIFHCLKNDGSLGRGTTGAELRMADEWFSGESTVLTYALPRPVMHTLKAVCEKLGVKIWDADCLTDLLAVPCFLMLCDFSSVDHGQLKETYGNLVEVGDSSLVFTARPAVRPPEALRKHIVTAPACLDSGALRSLIVRQMSAYPDSAGV